MTLASQVAEWVARVRFDDLPSDIVDATKLRILDVLGLALAGAETRFGRAIHAGAVAMSPPGPCRILGSGDNGIELAQKAQSLRPGLLVLLASGYEFASADTPHGFALLRKPYRRETLAAAARAAMRGERD